jgi:hypothetical protein
MGIDLPVDNITLSHVRTFSASGVPGQKLSNRFVPQKGIFSNLA